MTGGAPERLALALREAHPDAEPLDVDREVLVGWLAQAGVDPADDELVAAALVAWEALLG